MAFIHDDPDFDDLLEIVADELGRPRGFVEKDYWVTHALWALHRVGFDVWFKGGTSLSKGFDLIERFSEDLDLRVEPGHYEALKRVENWKTTTPRACNQRREYFEQLTAALTVPGATVALAPDNPPEWRSAVVRVHYPCKYAEDLVAGMTPFVQLEIGNARVAPSVLRDISSFVHDKLNNIERIGTYDENRPRQVRCFHPIATLFEKLDALCKRFGNGEPAKIVRHYEDAAKIIRKHDELMLSLQHTSAHLLAGELFPKWDVPRPLHEAFAAGSGVRWDAFRKAHADIGGMFWGERIPLETACAEIRHWLQSNVGARMDTPP